MNDIDLKKIIQTNSPDGGFLQSSEWRRFQKSVGRRVFEIIGGRLYASIIEHDLPIVGKYFYVPRGPIVKKHESDSSSPMQARVKLSKIAEGFIELTELSRKNKAGWIRIDPKDGETLGEIARNIKYKIVKAPHDVQPKEIFVIDITKSEEVLLAEMKSKTRYNIKLAEKRGVKIFNFQFSIFNEFSSSNDKISNKKYIDEFLRLVKVTAERDGIVSHPGSYYRKMFETIPEEMLKLYVAEYEDKVIAANLVLFYGDTCTYMHGASDNEHRNVMAPYLLQWKQIQDAKAAGCEKYDFGGVRTTPPQPSPDYKGGGGSSWSGITRFKTGFSPQTGATIFPGSYDIIINPKVYWLYRIIQKVKGFLR